MLHWVSTAREISITREVVMVALLLGMLHVHEGVIVLLLLGEQIVLVQIALEVLTWVEHGLRVHVEHLRVHGLHVLTLVVLILRKAAHSVVVLADVA